MSLSIRGMNVFYDDFHVLHDVSLDVDDGQLIGIVGANGHGKSTLLKAICGLVPPRTGTITYRGERIDHLAAPDLVARGIVHVAEQRHLFSDMTVRENLMLGAYLPRGRGALARNLERGYSLYPRLAERPITNPAAAPTASLTGRLRRRSAAVRRRCWRWRAA